MPVIRSSDYTKFQDYLTSEGIKNKILKKDVGLLKPSQRQIYLSNILKNLKKSGISGTMKWIQSQSLFIISKDNFIIDGHHRYATAILINPKTKVRCLFVDLPQSELLKIALHFSDKIAKNTRNENIN